MNDSTHNNSPIAKRLRANAERTRKEFATESSVSASSFGVLASRARQIEQRLYELQAPEQARDTLAAHRRLLLDVQTQLDDPSSGGVPPTNDAIYASAIEITEIEAILTDIASSGKAWKESVFKHLAQDEIEDERPTRRLELLWGTLCRRARLKPTPNTDKQNLPFTLDQDGWRVGCAFGIGADLKAAAEAASDALRTARQPGMVVLDVGSALPVTKGGLRVAEDRAGIRVMTERLDTFLVDQHPDLVEAVDPDFAFGIAIHATLSAINAASGRILFANHFRIANLCPPEDNRIPRLKRIMDAVSRVKPDQPVG